jgi:hypothetical protein
MKTQEQLLIEQAVAELNERAVEHFKSAARTFISMIQAAQADILKAQTRLAEAQAGLRKLSLPAAVASDEILGKDVP